MPCALHLLTGRGNGLPGCAYWSLHFLQFFYSFGSNEPLVFPSTSGEGSAICQGASRSRQCRLQFSEIKISLRLLHIEGRGLLDLLEIYQFSPSKRCTFDFRHPTFAYTRANHTPGAPALRTCTCVLFGHSRCFRYVCSTSKATDR